MLAPRYLTDEQSHWNARWGAPFGYPGSKDILRHPRLTATQAQRLAGPFAFQNNNTTRTIEYPWVFQNIPSETPATIIDVGGGLCGLQFVLAKHGHHVSCVDPGLANQSAEGYGWGAAPLDHAQLNAAFHTDVQPYPVPLEDTGFAPGTIDYITCVSTIEHIPEAGAVSLVRRASELLRPGGRLVATVDLFLNLEPFARRTDNEWGTNIDIAALLRSSADLSLAVGLRDELNGFPEFDPERIMRRLEHYFIGLYPCMAQCFVFEKHNPTDGGTD